MLPDCPNVWTDIWYDDDDDNGVDHSKAALLQRSVDKHDAMAFIYIYFAQRDYNLYKHRISHFWRNKNEKQ